VLDSYTPAATEKARDDGKFWMSFSDFARHYSSVYVCRVFNTQVWHKYTGKAAWRGKTAGGSPGNSTCKDNPQFKLVASAPTHVFATLTQDNMSRGSEVHISFFIVYKKGKRARSLYRSDNFHSSGTYTNVRSVRCQ